VKINLFPCLLKDFLLTILLSFLIYQKFLNLNYLFQIQNLSCNFLNHLLKLSIFSLILHIIRLILYYPIQILHFYSSLLLFYYLHLYLN